MTYFAGKNVLVTGGAGFIGSYLVEYLLQDGATVTVVDNLSRGRLENLEGVAADVRVVQGDLRLPHVAASACQGQSVVMNLAAPVAGVEYSQRHHAEMLTDTILINSNTITAAVRAGAERFLYCSSSCVYPDDATVPTPEEEGWSRAPETANAGYGWGKRIGELQAQYISRETAMTVAIARPFNAYGPREHPEEITRAHVIPAIISRFLRGDDPVVVWGDGDQTRSFVHARDFAMGLKLVTEHYAVADPVNIGHSQETSIRELVALLSEVIGVAPKVEFDASKPIGARRKSSDTTKLRRVTGFIPRTDLREGLAEMVAELRLKVST